MGYKGSSVNAQLSAVDGDELVCVPNDGCTTWTFEPRGNAYVYVSPTSIHFVGLSIHKGLEMLQMPKLFVLHRVLDA